MATMMLAIMLVMILIMMLKICKHGLGLNIRHGVGHDVKNVIHDLLNDNFNNI
jgi:hypothetical protein